MIRTESRETSASHSPRSYSSESYTDQGSLVAHSIRNKSPTRLKRAHNKVRTGCLTCRRRRVKCDEKKPSCDRCIKADRVCDGYKDPSGKFLESPERNAESTVLLPRPNLSNFSSFLDESDMTTPFVAFLENTAPRMATCFVSMLKSALDHELTILILAEKAQYLWKTLIPTVSQHDPATRYSAVALSSIHRSIELSEPFTGQNQPFARYYDKAIKLVKEGQCGSAYDLILFPCIVFAHCELLMGNSADAMTHIFSGTKIIAEIRNAGEALPDVVPRVIEPILSIFVAKSQTLGPGSLESYFPTTINALAQETTPLPESFSSLASAGTSLHDILYLTLLLQELGQPCDRSMATEIRKYANKWSIAFDKFRFAPENEVLVMKRHSLLLLAEHRMIQLLLKSMPPEADASFLKATADFRVIFAQLKTFWDEKDQDSGILDETDSQPCLSSGHIMPLFFTALYCRVYEIRLSAMELLRDLKVSEGQWNSCLAHAVCQKVVELSNRQLLKTKPTKVSKADLVQIKPTSLEWAAGGRPRLQYLSFGADGRPGDAGSVFIEQRTCFHNVDLSGSFSTMLRCHGFQGSVTPRALVCDCDIPRERTSER